MMRCSKVSKQQGIRATRIDTDMRAKVLERLSGVNNQRPLGFSGGFSESAAVQVVVRWGMFSSIQASETSLAPGTPLG
jgi:hypothetical protein